MACYVLTKENGLGLDTYDYFAIFKNTTIPTEFARLNFRYKQSFNAGAADLADDLESVELPPRITRCSNELVMDLDSIEKSANNWTDTIYILKKMHDMRPSTHTRCNTDFLLIQGEG